MVICAGKLCKAEGVEGVALGARSRSTKAGAGGLQLVRMDDQHRYLSFKQALYEDSLGALYGHPLYTHLLQCSAQLGDASLVVGEAALKEDLAPRLLYVTQRACSSLAQSIPAALLVICLSIHKPPPPLLRSVAACLRRRLVVCGLDEDEVPLRMLIGRRSRERERERERRRNALLPLRVPRRCREALHSLTKALH